MEYTSYTCVGTSQDSGLGESSQNESNPDTLFTPTTTLITSRKRKFKDLKTCKSLAIKMIPSMDSTDSSPWIGNSKIHSSTMNDSISAGVEKCTLDNFASNFYIERSDIDNTDTSSFFNNMKEPLTPEKCSSKRYYNSMSSPRVSPMLKLGSPERNEILYSKLPNSSRFTSSKRSSPAKKCLFTLTSRKDPVAFFCKERRLEDLMSKIFLMLCDESLYTCSKVSKGWRDVIMLDKKLKLRLQLFINQKIMNKENICDSPQLNTSTNNYCGQFKQSTPIESVVTPSKIFEVTNSFTEGHHLEKCISCNKPDAVVKDNISQCTNCRCGTIRCVKCNSISTTGPENFIDKCQQSMLDYEKPSPKYALLSSPKRYQNDNGIPTFFLDDSLNFSPMLNSSGYITDSELSQNSRRNSTSFNKGKLDISQVLKTNNMNITNKPDKDWQSRIPVLPVITSTKQMEEVIEPSSPPKVKHVAGSKKSKKMLKRLNW